MYIIKIKIFNDIRLARSVFKMMLQTKNIYEKNNKKKYL